MLIQHHNIRQISNHVNAISRYQSADTRNYSIGTMVNLLCIT